MDTCGIHLTSLDVSWSTITGEGFNVLQDKFTNMEKLCLQGCLRLTPQGLVEILDMCGGKLKDLNISWTNVTGHCLDELQGKFADLKKLNLYNLSLTDQGLLQVLRMCGTKLQEINISNTNVTGQGLDDLQGKFAYLEILNLNQCRSLTDQGLLKVLRMCGSKLQDLDISETSITGQGLEDLQGKMADLKTLTLRCCSSLTDQGLLMILMMCGTKLLNINISITDITGQGLEEMEGKFADLKTLNLEDCIMVTQAQGFSNIINISGPLLETVVWGFYISTEVKNRLRLNRPNLRFLD